jgi:transcription elongation factor Elf1
VTVLGPDGKPVEPPECPRCGARGKRVTENSFGGHYIVACGSCGHEYERGRKRGGEA